MNIDSYSYLEIIQENNSAKPRQKNAHKILILANIVTNPFYDVLKFYFSKLGLSFNIVNGSYNNIVQDSKEIKSDSAIIFFELSQISEGFSINSSMMEDENIDIIEDRIKNEINIVLENLSHSKVVLFNKFSSHQFSSCSKPYIKLIENLNVYLSDCCDDYPNLKLIDLDQIFLSIGKKNAIDLRGLYNYKIMYTIDFYKYYAQYVLINYLPLFGVYKKVLVMDCDNTLWRGIIGEDGIDGIEMSSSGIGLIYREIQYIVLSLVKKGVILCLCSKNNQLDIDNVINKHPDFIINAKDIAFKMVNWIDKSENILSISKELNVGVDSIVYVDDSKFEIGLINEQLPEVECMMVPTNIYDYPDQLLKFTNIFFSNEASNEDYRRVERNEENHTRMLYKENFFNLKDYLSSLNIQLDISSNQDKNSLRLSQLSQKTNQFNLTTKRYSEADIKSLICDSNYDVFSISSNDIFGSSGIVSLLIVKYTANDSATIDSFMLSCRVLSRNIEFAIIYFLFNYLKKKNIKILEALYIQSQRNIQTKTFYQNCGFDILDDNEVGTSYKIILNEKTKNMINYINVLYAK
jgi:FkbH-like protein